MKYFLYIPLFILCLFSCAVRNHGVWDQQSLDKYRNNYKKGFLENPRSPLDSNDIHFLDFYAWDPTWKLDCSCKEKPDSKPFEMPTYSGVTRMYVVHAELSCKYKNMILHLQLYKNIQQPINPLYKNQLFLPFKDLTNNDETYGGGRYINLQTTDIKKGKIKVDFNTCYNPWCAYSSGFNCPIPPKFNHMDVEVTAGEKKFKGSYKNSTH